MAETHFRDLKPSSIIILVADLVVILTTFLIGASLEQWYFVDSAISFTKLSLYFHLIILTPTLLLTILAVGLYNEKLRETFSGVTTRIGVSTISAYLLAKLIYLITVIEALPGYFNECYFVSLFFVFLFTRFVASKTQYKQIGVRKILVLGAGTRASIIEKSMRRKTDRIGIHFVGFLPMKGDAVDGLKNETKIKLNETLEEYAIEKDIAEIVIAADERRNVLPTDSLFKCKRRGIKITDIIDFLERETGQVAVNHIYPSWIIYSTNNSSNSVKRIFDWVFNTLLALFIFSLTWPIMVITFLAIKFEEGVRSPVLYSQKRTGLNGGVFDIYKFRSMRTDAEKEGAKWAQKEDPRVTRVGNIIRKYRIDELPQLFNVIKGDMGFVGPRPERPHFSDKFEISIPYYNHRLNVKPGLTGWAQLKYPYGSSEEDSVEKLKFDLYYIKNRSFLFDLLILLRTAEIILFGKGQ